LLLFVDQAFSVSIQHFETVLAVEVAIQEDETMVPRLPVRHYFSNSEILEEVVQSERSQ
jgi:hypothetical protein